MTKYILIIIAIFVIAAGTASAATVYVPPTHPTIQAAVDSVCPGDTIYVYNGTYIENVTVKKGILLQGEGKDVVTIDGNGGTALDIKSSNVDISGFTITNSQDGIAMTISKNCTISDCDLHSNANGIHLLMSCNYNTISDCTMHLNSNCGISLCRACKSNTICACDAYSNEKNGILVFTSCDNNSIIDCNAYSNDDSGIMLQKRCSGNTIENCNTTSNLRNGIILFQASGGNLIRNCNAHSNQVDGIVLFQTSNGNMIQDCGAHSNSRTGIYISHTSAGNTVTGCDANNTNGIHISHASNGNMVLNCNVTSNLQRGVSITMNSKGNEIACCMIDSAEYGVVMSRVSTGNVVSGTTVSNTSSRDFLLEYASSGSAIETPFETIGVSLASVLSVRNYLDVKVMDGVTSVEGADIRVTDNGHVVYASSGYGGSDPCTDSAGLCSGILVTDRVYHHLSSAAAENTTLVSAKHGAWEETDRDADMSESRTEEFSALTQH